MIPIDSTQSRSALAETREELDQISSKGTTTNGICDKHATCFKDFRLRTCKTEAEAKFDAEVDTTLAVKLYRGHPTCFTSWGGIVSLCEREYNNGGAELWYLCHIHLTNNKARMSTRNS